MKEFAFSKAILGPEGYLGPSQTSMMEHLEVQSNSTNSVFRVCNVHPMLTGFPILKRY